MKQDKECKKEEKAEQDRAAGSAEREASEEGKAADSSAKADEVNIKPYGEKIGEGPDNLRRREEWFQQRTGKGE